METRRTASSMALAAAIALTPDASVKVGIEITSLAEMPPRQLRLMKAETEAIWKPYGISITWIAADAARVPPSVQRSWKVVVAPRDGARDGRRMANRRLGAVLFLETNEVSDNAVIVSVETIEDIVNQSRWAGRRVTDWPVTVRQDLLGRALGRVLAHEIGHSFLVWRGHTPDGLMRSSFPGDLLVSPARDLFELSPQLMPRLRARAAQVASAGSTIVEAR